MKIETLTIKEYMEITAITEIYKKDINKYRKKIIEYFDGSLKVPKEVGDETIKTLEKVLKVETNSVLKFEIGGIEYGRIPNFDKLSTGEFIDLEEYMKDGNHLDRIMAILYRPVIKSKGELYQIEEYEGTDKYVDIMKGVDFKIVKSAMVFFYHLEKSLLKAFDIYTSRSKRKMILKMMRSDIYQRRLNSVKNFFGIQCSTPEQKKSILK